MQMTVQYTVYTYIIYIAGCTNSYIYYATLLCKNKHSFPSTVHLGIDNTTICFTFKVRTEPSQNNSACSYIQIHADRQTDKNVLIKSIVV